MCTIVFVIQSMLSIQAFAASEKSAVVPSTVKKNKRRRVLPRLLTERLTEEHIQQEMNGSAPVPIEPQQPTEQDQQQVQTQPCSLSDTNPDQLQWAPSIALYPVCMYQYAQHLALAQHQYQLQHDDGHQRQPESVQEKYVWCYKTVDGAWRAYSAETSAKLDDTAVGDSFAMVGQFLITKQTSTTGIIRNFHTNYQREIVRKVNALAGEEITGKEKDHVFSAFHESVVFDHQIATVTRVARKDQELIYETILAEKCRKRGKPREHIEKWLWHGVSDYPFSKKWTYFAKNARYCVNRYCDRADDGFMYILLCKVIAGEYTVGLGHEDENGAPQRQDGAEIDAKVDSLDSPSIFVITRDYHALPCYLIKFKDKFQHWQHTGL